MGLAIRKEIDGQRTRDLLLSDRECTKGGFGDILNSIQFLHKRIFRRSKSKEKIISPEAHLEDMEKNPSALLCDFYSKLVGIQLTFSYLDSVSAPFGENIFFFRPKFLPPLSARPTDQPTDVSLAKNERLIRPERPKFDVCSRKKVSNRISAAERRKALVKN